MALQSSGPISLNDIATEFGGSTPHSLSEYYGSGGAPASGPLSIGDFYGLSASFTFRILAVAAGGSGGGGGSNSGGGGGAGGQVEDFTVSNAQVGHTLNISFQGGRIDFRVTNSYGWTYSGLRQHPAIGPHDQGDGTSLINVYRGGNGGWEFGGSSGGGGGYVVSGPGSPYVTSTYQRGWGGDGGSALINYGGGGGGSTGNGGNASGTTPGNGGSGTVSNITGSNVTYGGGGGGSHNNNGTGGSGGSGGGGQGGSGGLSIVQAVAGTDGLGGGGGGNAQGAGYPNNGGTGVVYVRLPNQAASYTTSNATETTVDGEYLYKFIMSSSSNRSWTLTF